jgi:hypothetical protein
VISEEELDLAVERAVEAIGEVADATRPAG